MDGTNFKGLLDIFSPEEIEKRSRENYEVAIKNPNLLSFWYPKIESAGILTPKSSIYKLSYDETQFLGEMVIDKGFSTLNMTSEEIIKSNDLLCKLWSSIDFESDKYFIKTGTYSNKFEFENSIIDTREDLDDALASVYYYDLMVGAGGQTELALREYIESKEDLPTIYSGMPLRPEYRVFYDFDNNKVVYNTEYWEYDTMINGIHDEQDREVYKSTYPNLHKNYISNLDPVLEYAKKELPKIKGLEGIWSVDFMLDRSDSSEKIWLIDMALGKNSYFWDPKQVEEYYERNE